MKQPSPVFYSPPASKMQDAKDAIFLLTRFYFEQKMQVCDMRQLIAIEREILRITEPSHTSKAISDPRILSLQSKLKDYYTKQTEQERERMYDSIYGDLGRVGRDYQSLGIVYLHGEGRLLSIYVDFNNDTLQYIKDRIAYYIPTTRGIQLLDRYSTMISTVIVDRSSVERHLVDSGRHIGHYGFHPGSTIAFHFTETVGATAPRIPTLPRTSCQQSFDDWCKNISPPLVPKPPAKSPLELALKRCVSEPEIHLESDLYGDIDYEGLD
jgi:hypothetical protein